MSYRGWTCSLFSLWRGTFYLKRMQSSFIIYGLRSHWLISTEWMSAHTHLYVSSYHVSMCLFTFHNWQMAIVKEKRKKNEKARDKNKTTNYLKSHPERTTVLLCCVYLEFLVYTFLCKLCFPGQIYTYIYTYICVCVLPK